eukprot:11898724-Alexandrium_andersonii.AAC.1
MPEQQRAVPTDAWASALARPERLGRRRADSRRRRSATSDRAAAAPGGGQPVGAWWRHAALGCGGEQRWPGGALS